MTRQDVLFLSAVALMLGGLAFKIRHLRRRWSSPQVWAVCATAFFPILALGIAAPNMQVRLRALTGIANFPLPVVYSCACASSASFLALVLLWRYPARTAWLRIRWVLAVYVLVIVVICVLFAVSSTPVPRRFDFETYYADQPTVAAMVLIWHVSGMAGTGMLAYWCLTWARDPDYDRLPWLRLGLRLYGACGLSTMAFHVTRCWAVIADQFGTHAFDRLSAAVPGIFMPLSALFLASALVLPVVRQRLPAGRTWASRWRAFRVLRPLHRALRPVGPESVMVSSGRRWNPHHRVRRMVIELSDWRWMLAPLFDAAVSEWAERLADEAGLTEEERKAVVEAAVLKAAVRDWRQGGQEATGGLRHAQADEPAQDGSDFAEELAWWVRVARAYASSPVLDRALAGALATPSPTG